MKSPVTAMQPINWDAVPASSPLAGVERRMVWGDSLMVCRLRIDPHVVTAIHSHPHEQITLVEKGRVKFFIAGEERIVGPGDVLHFPSNLEHGATMLDEEVVLVDIFTPVREEFLS